MIFAAIEFAAKAHSGQHRKGTKLPYIVHPLGVARILIEHDCPDEVVVAGLLHDTVEDTAITLEDIRGSFGDRVAQIVQAASEPDKADTWENRKRHTIEYLKTAPTDVLLVSLADKLDNMRAIRADYAKLGDALWSRFNQPQERQGWYYRSLAEVFEHRRIGVLFDSLVSEFRSEVNKIFSSRP